MAKTPEGKVQEYAVKRAKEVGAFVRKLAWEGRNGAPDLLIILPNGVVLFMEMKKDEKTGPDPIQVMEHRRMRQRGANVFVVGSEKEVDRIIADYYIP